MLHHVIDLSLTSIEQTLDYNVMHSFNKLDIQPKALTLWKLYLYFHYLSVLGMKKSCTNLLTSTQICFISLQFWEKDKHTKKQ